MIEFKADMSGNFKLGSPHSQLSSLRSPNAINKFAFALGDRKLLKEDI